MRKTLKITLFILTLLFLTIPNNFSEEINSIKLEPADTMEEIIAKAANVKPDKRQINWQKLEYTAFIHFGMNTFTDSEWGYGKENPKLFNPTKFDARQWVKVLKAAGFTKIILTAKHHDGFCLWQTKYTKHSVKYSHWKGGKGDVVKEVADACKELGVKFGIYLSPWDRHEKTYGKPEYNDYYKNQLRELLSNYGEISEVWFDGACGFFDYRCKYMQYDWEGIIKIVRELQPKAVMFGGANDIRWVGNEAGKPRESEWSVQPESYNAGDPELGSREKLISAAKDGMKLRWLPAETDTSIRPGWFYHQSEDSKVKSLDDLLDIYYGSVGGNSVLLLNIPPDRRGLINENDIKRLMELREVLDKTFKKNLALNSKAEASSVRGKNSKYSAVKTLDNDIETYWTTDDGITSADIIYDLGNPKKFNVTMLQEDIRQGQRIEEFYLEVWDGKNWIPVAMSTTVGYKRLLRFKNVTAQKVKIKITKSRVCPTLANFGLYYYEKEKL